VDGYLSGIGTEELGVAARYLGAGRTKIDEKIDPGAGIIVVKKIGDYVRAGETIAQMHSNDPHAMAAVRGLVDDAFHITSIPHEAPPLIYDIIE
jgi:pyrimidine-nucleoside phosphorylase